MKIKVSEATPLQLNYLVAKCEGWEDSVQSAEQIWEFDEYGGGPTYCGYEYSTDPAQAYPIIEREKIQTVWRILDADGAGYWDASNLFADKYHYRGPTPLIAAMRCFVASRLGEEVEIPEELI